MPRTCTVCRLPEREAVDSLLVEGRVPLREIGKNHAVSASALQRHKTEHLPQVLVAAAQNAQAARGASLLTQVRQLQARSELILDKAEKSGDLRTALAAMRELRSVLDLLGRLATKSGGVIEVSVVEEYVAKIFDILHEFVPHDRLQAAIARLTDLLEIEAKRAAGTDHT